MDIKFENKPIDIKLIATAILMDKKMGKNIDNIMNDLKAPVVLDKRAKKKVDLLMILEEKNINRVK